MLQGPWLQPCDAVATYTRTDRLRGPGAHPPRLGRPSGNIHWKAYCLVSRGPLGYWCSCSWDEGVASSASITQGALAGTKEPTCRFHFLMTRHLHE